MQRLFLHTDIGSMIKRFFSRHLHRNRDSQVTRRHPVTGAACRGTSEAPLAAGKPVLPDARLAGELLALLLAELPDHRRALLATFESNEPERLAACTHKLLGAVVYCDLPLLSAALRELRQVCGDGDRAHVRRALHRTIRAVDDVLAGSGPARDQ
jgi:HPt (histidine-containing phosphotransfer) domain-containing protein